MKNISLFLILLFGFWSCTDDNAGGFNASIPKENISFKAQPGGAVMYYNLPKNTDIFAINVRYTDAIGEPTLKVGSYVCDSLVLDGFTTARSGESAFVTLVDRNNKESDPIEVYFDTQDAATITFFDNVLVTPHWGGFQIIYDGPELSTGMAHIFYLGTNPMTHDPDTILVKSFPITPGVDTMQFNLQQERKYNDIIIRTDDFKGFRVKQKTWEQVEALETEMLSPLKYELIVPSDIIFEKPEYKIGKEYLFDGDKNGSKAFTTGTTHLYIFTAGPNAKNKGFIFDLKREYLIASMRIYAPINRDQRWPSNGGTTYDTATNNIIYGTVYTKLPCITHLYATNDINDDNSWVRISGYNQSDNVNELAPQNRWAWLSYGLSTPKYVDPKEAEAADPVYMVMELTYGPTYRYLKLVVEEVFRNEYTNNHAYNPLNAVIMQELEIYVKKE